MEHHLLHLLDLDIRTSTPLSFIRLFIHVMYSTSHQHEHEHMSAAARLHLATYLAHQFMLAHTTSMWSSPCIALAALCVSYNGRAIPDATHDITHVTWEAFLPTPLLPLVHQCAISIEAYVVCCVATHTTWVRHTHHDTPNNMDIQFARARHQHVSRLTPRAVQRQAERRGDAWHVRVPYDDTVTTPTRHGKRAHDMDDSSSNKRQHTQHETHVTPTSLSQSVHPHSPSSASMRQRVHHAHTRVCGTSTASVTLMQLYKSLLPDDEHDMLTHPCTGMTQHTHVTQHEFEQLQHTCHTRAWHAVQYQPHIPRADVPSTPID